MSSKRTQGFINYFLRRDERKQLSKYLQTGGFKKIAGAKSYNKHITLRRAIFVIFSILVLGIGVYFAIF